MANPTEMVGRVVGAAKAAGAALAGYRGIFRRLKQEHGEVSVLMQRVATSKNPEVRRELFPRIRTELLSHAKSEEKEFYSALREHEATRDLVQHSFDEHKQMEDMLERLQTTPFTEPHWIDDFRELMRRVQDHVEEEEHKLFPKAKDIISHEQAEDIEDRYLECRLLELQSLLPH